MIVWRASRAQYGNHIGPLWDALPEHVKGPGDAVIVAGHTDLVSVARTHRRIAYLEHGIGQSYGPNGHPAYPGGKGRDAVNLFLSPNEHAAAMDRAAYPRARVEVIGDPRLDSLPQREPGPLSVALSFHWRCAVSFAGTAFDHYRGVIAELAKAYPLIGHAHPRAAPWLIPFYRRLRIPFEPSFDEIARHASVFIADNTSALYEAAHLGIPTVVLNSPTWDRGRSFGLRFWDAANVGVQVDEPAHLIRAVERALADPPEQQERREAALSIVYADRRPGVAGRAAGVLMDWLSERAEVAA